MAKIPLSITEDYCKDWKVWEGVREILQNYIDAHDDGYAGEVQYFPRTQKLVVTNRNVVLDHRVLLLGGTQGKSASARGKHREGMKIGLLALVRAGLEVSIYNGSEVWRPAIELWNPTKKDIAETDGEDVELPESPARILMVNTRKLGVPRKDFTVELEGLPPEVWEALRKRFLFITKPNDAETVRVTNGRILLEEAYKGSIFSRGIYVCTVEDIECGYDLDNLDLDRDRRLVNAWDLRYKLSNLWESVIRQDPERFSKRLYKMVKENTEEGKGLRSYSSDAKLVAVLRKELKEEHGGEDVVPVTNMRDAEELERMGLKPAIVDRGFKEILEKDGNTLERVKEKQRRGVKARVGLADLSLVERTALTAWVGKVTDLTNVVVVEFNDPKVEVDLLAEEGILAVARSLLSAPSRSLVDAVTYQEARRRKCDVAQVFLDMLFPPETSAAPASPPPVDDEEEAEEDRWSAPV